MFRMLTTGALTAFTLAGLAAAPAQAQLPAQTQAPAQAPAQEQEQAQAAPARASGSLPTYTCESLALNGPTGDGHRNCSAANGARAQGEFRGPVIIAFRHGSFQALCRGRGTAGMPDKVEATDCQPYRW